jgi:sensor c-di-GMP phosphodiesterase-like protein
MTLRAKLSYAAGSTLSYVASGAANGWLNARVVNSATVPLRNWNRRPAPLFFQPIVDLQNEAIIGFEALAHWTHRRSGTFLQNALFRLPRTAL